MLETSLSIILLFALYCFLRLAKIIIIINVNPVNRMCNYCIHPLYVGLYFFNVMYNIVSSLLCVPCFKQKRIPTLLSILKTLDFLLFLWDTGFSRLLQPQIRFQRILFIIVQTMSALPTGKN